MMGKYIAQLRATMFSAVMHFSFKFCMIIAKCSIWITSIKLSRIILLVTLLLILVPLFVHYYLSKVEKDAPQTVHRSQVKYEVVEEFDTLRASDLKYRIEEMLRIKGSVSNELRSLEAKSQKLQNEITFYHQQIEQLKSELSRQQSELNKLKISVQQAQLSRLEALQHNTPELALPLPLLTESAPDHKMKVSHIPSCHRMHGCFDYSRCSLTSGFPVYLYNPEDYFPSWNIPLYLRTLVRQTVGYNSHFVSNPNIACIFVVLVGEGQHFNPKYLENLSYWGGDGRNHLILNLSVKNFSAENNILSPSTDTGRAIIAQCTWLFSEFRQYHDLVIPPILGPPGGEIWSELPFIVPARRKYLISFQGYPSEINQKSLISFKQGDEDLTLFDIDHIRQYLTMSTSDEFYFDFNCGSAKISISNQGNYSEWLLCNTEKERSNILRDSTFVLVPSPLNPIYLSTVVFQARLLEALKYGAIPLVYGADTAEFPFSEVIDWSKVTISIPIFRVTECHWLLRSISDNDLLFMRRQARLLYEKYFATGQNILDTILALIRDRISIPPPAVSDVPSPSIFPPDFKPLRMDPVVPDAEPEENLGPLEPPFNSPKFQRNFSLIRTQGYELWNTWGDPFRLYPQVPFDFLLPSDAKFIGSSVGFRVINGGTGGAGKEFSENLGGNMQKEQFTIVILTYEREQVLMNSLSRLHGLPYLNKVVVVWNSATPPLQDLRWPDIGVPIHVVPVRKNSLNNRFLPFEAIETEAVLSVDDDAHLRHDEIIFGFRVWREQREHIVGFPGRYHALDLNHGGWLYNSNYSCELSMVLTGAAFVHKYYLYLYTYWLPQVIRDMVDEYMNCEDIAMNFLVSHVTRKPPVKVTSRWTFRCPGCPVSLSEDETHFNERHRCINFFSKVFGYTPLLNTQFRADSILFKTRIPHEKQKCFKFI